ncbi:MAG: hypothetical protein DRI84_04345 [Bacteroidetes bacterium]|nr:MAG: hypothetical protein DRI84_04345 [Bacteroidota bacterium]
MADSTAYIDTTSFYDATTIIVYDSTGAFDTSVANALVDEFDSFMGPLTSKCSVLEGELNGIKARISNCETTPPPIINTTMVNALGAAYGSSAWATSAALATQTTNAINKCSFFASYATDIPKFSEPGKLTDALNAGASTNTTQVVNDVIDEMKKEFPGMPFEELGLGAELDTLAGPPRPPYDAPKTSVTDPAEAASDIIPSGYSAVNQRKTPMSDIASTLKMMDSMVECTNSIGGSEFADQIDGMTAELDCFYDTVGLHSDPNKPNYGEFDIDKFLLGVDPTKASNIKKGMNLQAKSQGNTKAAVKTGANALTTESSGMGSGQRESMAIKKEYIKNNSKTVFTKPASGNEPEKLIQIPDPEPYQPKLVTPGEPPDPEPPKVPLNMYVSKKEKIVAPKVDYTYYDPNYTWIPTFYSTMYNITKTFKVSEPDFNVTLDLQLYFLFMAHQINKKVIDGIKYKYYVAGARTAGKWILTNTDNGKNHIASARITDNIGYDIGDKIPENVWEDNLSVIPSMMQKALASSIKMWPGLIAAEFERSLGIIGN